MQLTDYGFDIFFGPRNATVMFERAPRTKSKRERLIVFAEVVVDFAREKSSRVAGFLKETLALIQ